MIKKELIIGCAFALSWILPVQAWSRLAEESKVNEGMLSESQEYLLADRESILRHLREKRSKERERLRRRDSPSKNPSPTGRRFRKYNSPEFLNAPRKRRETIFTLFGETEEEKARKAELKEKRRQHYESLSPAEKQAYDKRQAELGLAQTKYFFQLLDAGLQINDALLPEKPQKSNPRCRNGVERTGVRTGMSCLE